jgi:hypothetical protein
MPETIFKKRERKAKPGFAMGLLLGRKPTKGAVGIEIEIEGKRLPHEDTTPAPWMYHHDGSLRGEDNGEYVLQTPIEFDKVGDALTKLWAVFEERKSVLDDSNRTSVHVHLNCQNFHLNRLTSFMALWFTLEEVLTAWCGEHRVGNLFCLRAKDAPAIIAQLRKFIKNDGASPLSEHLHYAGLNAHALHKFGSLEVRMLRGCSDPQVILDWLGILERLYKLSADYPDPRDICASFSSEGPLAFFEMLLGDRVSVVRAGIPYNDDQIRDAMYDGIRLAQDLCYCRDWEDYKATKLSADPFGRDLKKVVKKLQSAPPQSIPVSFDIETDSFSDDYQEPEPEYDSPDEMTTEALQNVWAQMSQVVTAPPVPPPSSVGLSAWSAAWGDAFNTNGGSNG